MTGRHVALPNPLTSFIGRKHELRGVRKALSEARLVTLTGIGGIGKTRLALRVAEQAHRAFPDGVWYVDLSALPIADTRDDPGAVVRITATALGLAPTLAGLDPLIEHLAGRTALLLLDGCEHRVHDCAQLATALLSANPSLRILATSQRCLGTDGERRILVSPLEAPAATAAASVARATDAVTLFLERAATNGNHLPDDDRTIQDIAALCRYHDAIPLAIELATENLRALTPAEILHHLHKDRFGPLAGGKRGGLPRHRTVMSELDWTFGLCTAAEQSLWIRLSVCSGGFDLPAAYIVAASEDAAPDDVLATIACLVDKSILQREDRPGHATRYRFLGTVRHYGLRRLHAMDAHQEIRERHAEYFLDRALRAAENWTDDFTEELPNLRDAFTTLAPSRPDDAVALVVALTRTQAVHQHRLHSHLVQLLPPTMELASRTATALHARAYAQASLLALWHGDISTAGNLLIVATRHSEQASPTEANIAPLLDMVRACHSGLVDALPSAGAILIHARRALSAAGRDDDAHLATLAAVLAALVAAIAGTKDDALAAAADCASLTEPDPSSWTIAWCLLPVGLVEARCGNRHHARTILRRVVHDMWAFGDVHATVWALLGLASIAAGIEQPQAAAKLLGITEAIQVSTGDQLRRLGLFSRLHADTYQAAARSLGAERYEAAYLAGAASDPAAGIAFALDERKPPARTGVTTEPARQLSPREYEVAGLVAQGLQNKAIASSLVIGIRTVDTHVAHIKEKLNLDSREEVAAWYATNHARQATNAIESSSTTAIPAATTAIVNHKEGSGPVGPRFH